MAFFQDFPVLENARIKFQDFPGFPGPVRTLLLENIATKKRTATCQPWLAKCKFSLLAPPLRQQLEPGAHHWEPAPTPYSCHGAFTDRSIFNLNLYRIQIPTGTPVTNCNHKHGLMLTCRHVHVRPHCFILTEACSRRLELAYFAGKMPLHWLIMEVARS